MRAGNSFGDRQRANVWRRGNDRGRERGISVLSRAGQQQSHLAGGSYRAQAPDTSASLQQQHQGTTGSQEISFPLSPPVDPGPQSELGNTALPRPHNSFNQQEQQQQPHPSTPRTSHPQQQHSDHQVSSVPQQQRQQPHPSTPRTSHPQQQHSDHQVGNVPHQQPNGQQSAPYTPRTDSSLLENICKHMRAQLDQTTYLMQQVDELKDLFKKQFPQHIPPHSQVLRKSGGPSFILNPRSPQYQPLSQQGQSSKVVGAQLVKKEDVPRIKDKAPVDEGRGDDLGMIWEPIPPEILREIAIYED